MVKRLLNRAGFTFVEMMIVVAILGIIAVTAPTLMKHLIRFYQLHNAKIEIQRDARASLDNINRFLRQAKSYTVSIGQVSGQPPFSQISFQTVDGQNMSFYQNGSTLYQVAQSTTPVTKNLRYIAFTFPRSDDPTIISVALTMEKATYQGAYKALELSIEKVRVMN
jgi:prepilin-type N-terminal cleavage/methylation domain-containing protein